jgi:DNA-binding CsgD family transcriptional regulator
MEVLRLVADGLTDAQVAEQFIISPRTVNWHLSSIYSKLQVSSRAAATRYAMEHHLLYPLCERISAHLQWQSQEIRTERANDRGTGLTGRGEDPNGVTWSH